MSSSTASNQPIIGFLRQRPWASRGLSVVSGVLMVCAVGVLGYPLYTNFYQSRLQNGLEQDLASPAIVAAYRERKVASGDSLTRIKIPSIDVDVVVVEGTSADALRAGAGHYPATPLPCEVGNVAIAGHRTTYGKPFNQLDRVKMGDEITLETPIGACTYVVSGAPYITAPTDLSALDPTTTGTLTLTTCHPKGSARQRLILKADLKS